ncbi:retrotransposon-like family member (retr-1) partial [Lentinula edodes]|uniref:Retrotransposon-like family member (Retr-1) partial n=1 Tax=Lentinula edodes TaxID=5353 RepID=A0A1Q3ETK9_LENED|nr:retrotransposon-like family member (retr-1) partial [Lentinula edodes]
MEINLKDDEGQQVEVKVMVDDGAMVAAMDTEVYECLRKSIGGWTATQKKFQMANGSVVPGKACWMGRVNNQGAEVEGGFEVFDSGGSWNFLFGKPLLEKFAAVHDYQKDSILLRGRKGNIREVFNEGLGAAIKGTLEEEDRDLPRPSAPVQAVLEESEGPLGGVIVKALTPLDREVENLFRIEWEHVANIDGQYLPRFEAPTRRQNPQIEEVPDEDLEHTHAGWDMPQEAPELPTSTTEED